LNDLAQFLAARGMGNLNDVWFHGVCDRNDLLT